MFLPSTTIKNQDKSRVRSKTVKVWRCKVCHTIFDSDPKRSLRFDCPACKALGSIYETRVKD